jgi:ZIP family zinc transporter
MDQFISQYHHAIQALLATLFTYAMTAAGALPVFFVRSVNQKLMDGMLGFAAGVMVAASYWSLLAPAIEMSGGMWQQATIGFLGKGDRH